jgi:ribonuclease R
MAKAKKKAVKDQKEALNQTIFEYISGKNFLRQSVSSLFEKLKIPPHLIELSEAVLNQLLAEKKIEIVDGFIEKPSHKIAAIVTTKGTISLHPRGFGFVTSQDLNAYPQDIFIPKPFINGAVEGDTVEVLIASTASPKGPEGQVIAVLKRANKDVAGTIKVKVSQDEYKLYAPLFGPQKEVLVRTKGKEKLQSGDRVIMEVTSWGSEKEPVVGTLKDVIGNISDPSIDIRAGILEFHLLHVFPKAAVEQAQSYGQKLSKEQTAGRKDLTKLECVTIDPTTAKDYDDALSVEKIDANLYRLWVHIADVSYYVTKDGALDDEAYKRGNSTYFPGKCVPMLPEELSNELCSLKEGVKRLAVTVEMVIGLDGQVQDYSIYRSTIKSAKRFTYEEAKEVLDGKKKSKHAPLLGLMVELCAILKRLRGQRGSLDLSMPDVDIIVDENGDPIGTHYIEYDITHQMVEEFMLKANEMVAFHLLKMGKPAVFRVHDKPEKEALEDFYALARVLGFNLPGEPSIDDMKKLFEAAKGSPYAYQLATNFIRSMKLAVYSDQNVGHYGLALEHYCHFTSPIRRYTDLVIHRLLFEDDTTSDLKLVAKHCSDTERKSFKAENSVVQLKQLRYLEKVLKNDPNAIYTAAISKVKPFGISFQLEFLLYEGFLHVSELSHDYYEFVQKKNALIGERTGHTLTNGEIVNVRIVSVNLVERLCKFELVIEKKKK